MDQPGRALYPNLFSPLRLGPRVARNRITYSAHSAYYGEGETGWPSERHIAYHRDRARGGAGFGVIEGARVLPNSLPSSRGLGAFNPAALPMYRRLAEATVGEGLPTVVQLLHMGRQTNSAGSRLPLYAPSAIPCGLNREVPHAMGRRDIREVVEAFGRAARLVDSAGFDGVEVHAAHGYLIQQFMSPLSNRRSDEYGGSLDNRLRFAFEVIETVRAALGPDRIVGVRLSGDEFAPEGLALPEMVEVARRLAASGLVDYLSISQCNYTTSFPTMIPDESFVEGAFVYLASEIRRAVPTLPIFTVGRIKRAEHAERILAEGHADAVVMTRALIADPALPSKLLAGWPDDVRGCISCNQGCVGMIHADKPMTCLQNPAAGYEATWGLAVPPRTRRPRRVVVVGGGPAGLEAAITAAEAGHRVTLLERSDRLGGAINLALRLPKRHDFAEVIRWRQHMLDRLGVDVQLGVEATAAELLALAPDAIVVATGARPVRPAYPGLTRALTVEEILREEVRVAGHVLLIDETGTWKGAGFADWLLDAGCRVTVLTTYATIGADVPAVSLIPLKQRIYGKGAAVHVHSALRRVESGCPVVANVYGGSEQRLDPADHVVAALPGEADDALYRELEALVEAGAGFELHGAGDCYAPRDALDAIRDGHRIARLLAD